MLGRREEALLTKSKLNAVHPETKHPLFPELVSVRVTFPTYYSSAAIPLFYHQVLHLILSSPHTTHSTAHLHLLKNSNFQKLLARSRPFDVHHSHMSPTSNEASKSVVLHRLGKMNNQISDTLFRDFRSVITKRKEY
jgi:hypothetical protein